MVLAHGFSGTQDTPSFTAIARAFAAAGFFALTFDYRGFGESDGEPRQVIDIDEQLGDIRAAMAFARRQVEIDPERIALWGTSLGGGHAVVAGAEDPRLAVVIAQIPFNGFPDKVEGRSASASATRRPDRTCSTTRARNCGAYERGIFLLAVGRHSHEAGPTGGGQIRLTDQRGPVSPVVHRTRSRDAAPEQSRQMLRPG